MNVKWTKNDMKKSKKRLYHLYINAPADYRFIWDMIFSAKMMKIH